MPRSEETVGEIQRPLIFKLKSLFQLKELVAQKMHVGACVYPMFDVVELLAVPLSLQQTVSGAAAGMSVAFTCPAGKRWYLRFVSARRTTGVAALGNIALQNLAKGSNLTGVASVAEIPSYDFNPAANIGGPVNAILDSSDTFGVNVTTAEAASVFTVYAHVLEIEFQGECGLSPDVLGTIEKAVGFQPSMLGVEAVSNVLSPVYDVREILAVRRMIQGDQLSLSVKNTQSLVAAGAAVPVGKVWRLKYLSSTVTVAGSSSAGWQHLLLPVQGPGLALGGGCGVNDPLRMIVAAATTPSVVLGMAWGFPLDLVMVEGDEVKLQVNVVDPTEKVASNIWVPESDVV